MNIMQNEAGTEQEKNTHTHKPAHRNENKNAQKTTANGWPKIKSVGLKRIQAYCGRVRIEMTGRNIKLQ